MNEKLLSIWSNSESNFMIYWQNLKHHLPDAAERESLFHLLGKEPSDICKCSWLEHGGRNVIFPLRSAVCSTIQIWEKFGLWDMLFSFMLNDALDSLLAAFQRFHIGVSLLNSRTDSFLACLCRVCISSAAPFHRRLSDIASLSLRACSSGSELCVSRVKSLSETFNVKQHRGQTSPSSSYLTDDFS